MRRDDCSTHVVRRETMVKWTDHTKIHEGCGGIVRWVEAIDRPGVGWTGECRHCDTEGITVEQMLPIRGLDIETAFETPRERLAELRWDEDDTWNHNQKRLAKAIESDD